MNDCRFMVSIECFDHGSPPLSSRSTFPVIIMDTNDHAPHFSQYQYMASISEGNKLNVPVLQVQARDSVGYVQKMAIQIQCNFFYDMIELKKKFNQNNVDTF